MFLFANLCYDLINKFDDGLVYFMSFVNSLNHFCFRNLICSGLNHDHFLTGRSNGQVQITFLPLLLAGIDDELAIDHATWVIAQGPSKGISEMQVAIAAPIIATNSGRHSGSTLITMLFRVTSLR